MTNFNDTLDPKFVAKQLLKELKFKKKCKISESLSTNSVYITMPLNLVVNDNPITIKLFRIRVSDHPWRTRKRCIFDKLALHDISLRTDLGISALFSEIDRVAKKVNQMSTLAVYSSWWENLNGSENGLYLDVVTKFLEGMRHGSNC